MSQKQITLDELISYFEGKAPDVLIERIERQRMEDEEFAEEMEDWESRLQDEEEAGEVLNRMKMIQQAWQETEVGRSSKKKLVFPTWAPLAMAAAVVFLVLIFLNVKPNNASISDQLALDLDSKVSLLIGPEAGVGSDRVKDAKAQIWNAFEQGELEEALKQVDSLINLQPGNASYIMLKGLIFEKYGKSEEALVELEATLKHPDLQIEESCESLWYISLIHAKLGAKSNFDSAFQRWKEGRCGELDAERLKSMKQIEKNL